MKTNASPPMTIRIDAGTKARLKRAATHTKLASSAIIRLGLLKALSDLEKGTLQFPSSSVSNS